MPTCDDDDVDVDGSSFRDCLEPSERETSVGQYLHGFSDGGNYYVYALSCNTHRVVVREAPFLRAIQVQPLKQIQLFSFLTCGRQSKLYSAERMKKFPEIVIIYFNA